MWPERHGDRGDPRIQESAEPVPPPRGDGARITVTDRGRPVAVIIPPESGPGDEAIARMVREGLARWEGGRPPVARRTYRIRGKPISDTVIEDRR